MRKTTLLASITLAMGMLCACTQEETDAPMTATRQPITAEQASANALTFLSEFLGNTRGTGALEIESVEAIGYSGNRIIGTRAAPEENVAYYAVNLKDNKGFVLTSADARYIPIYAYVPENCYSEEYIQNNVGLSFYMESLKERIANDDETLWQSRHIQTLQNTSISPLLQTAWGPGMPYNIHSYTLHHATSMDLALGQICAYYAYPDSVTINGTTYGYDWDSILSECASNNGTLLTNSVYGSDVSRLCIYLGGQTDNVTPQLSNICLYKMAGIGYDYNGLLWTLYDEDPDIIEALTDGIIVFASGSQYIDQNNNYSGGAAWLIDGYQSGLYHINWGLYGYGNGYFALEATGSNHLNYQYQTAYTTISPADN